MLELKGLKGGHGMGLDCSYRMYRRFHPTTPNPCFFYFDKLFGIAIHMAFFIITSDVCTVLRKYLICLKCTEAS